MASSLQVIHCVMAVVVVATLTFSSSSTPQDSMSGFMRPVMAFVPSNHHHNHNHHHIDKIHSSCYRNNDGGDCENGYGLVLNLSPTTMARRKQMSMSPATATTVTTLLSSFYDKFEEFDDDEDDEDDDDEYAEMDERSIADFKSKMSNLFDEGSTTTDNDGSSSSSSTSSSSATVSSVDDLINFARASSSSGSGDISESEWAKPLDGKQLKIQPGTVLIANPIKFCEMPLQDGPTKSDDYDTTDSTDDGNNALNAAANRMFRMALGGGGTPSSSPLPPNPALLNKFGLTRPPPRSLGADRQADLLPVVVIVDTDDRAGVQGVLLNRRTGYLLGDLEQPGGGNDGGGDASNIPPILEKFCIQPLWFGGVDNISTGLDMLHLCPSVQGSTKITDDGMFWGGDPSQAQDALDDDPSKSENGRVFTGFDFKFFVQSTIWSVKDLQKEIDGNVWFQAHVAKDVLFKSRDRMGTKKAKPLWTEIMELLSKEDELYGQIMNNFYAAGEESFPSSPTQDE